MRILIHENYEVLSKVGTVKYFKDIERETPKHLPEF